MKPAFLYVEDDTLSREIMQLMMESLEHNLITFEDSHDFMERVEKLNPPPRVILLDIHVPPYDGFAMLEMLRQNSAYKESRIIAVTASVMNEEIERLRRSGFDGAIGKPLDFEQFPMLLEQLLQGDAVWHIS
jgi:two-component system, cell cycle response regulator DivK